jgi:predicted phage terminase large subunit-like protein
MIIRAAKYKSRHAVLRFRFNHVKASIIYDTLPKVMDLCYPELKPRCKLDKSDWFYKLPNGSEIWFGGLDDKERTEKILGSEFSTIFLNECSQIPWASRNMAMTRLAEKSDLRLKAYYDCNPPNQGHWTHRLFVEKIQPDTRHALGEPDAVATMSINPKDNLDNLPEEYIRELEAMPERMRQRFLYGLFGSSTDSALWTIELIEQQRFNKPQLPEMQRVVIAVDPSGASGPEDTRSDEIGIVVCGLATDGNGYVLEDLSGRFGPAQWGQIVGKAFERHEADTVIAETNFGGAMVGEIIRAARPGTPFREVTPSRGKIDRAEPISSLFEQQKVFMAGTFPILEDQLVGMTTAGYVGDKSPDRADAMVWGLAHLFPGLTRRENKELGRAPRVVMAYENVKQRGHRAVNMITRRG